MPNLILLPLGTVGAVTGPLLLGRTIMWLLKEEKINKFVPSCDSVVHTRGACCVKERFVLVWSDFIRTPSIRFRFIALLPEAALEEHH